MKIYSLEVYIPYTLNKACREQDYDKVYSLGAYANALHEIVLYANEQRKGKDKFT